MKIALIIENSQAAKNGIIHEALTEVVGPLGHQVFNYRLQTPDSGASSSRSTSISSTLGARKSRLVKCFADRSTSPLLAHAPLPLQANGGLTSSCPAGNGPASILRGMNVAPRIS